MADTYEFSKEDLEQIEKIKSKYPEVQPAVMPVLWLAQEKFGHVDSDVQKLVADTLGLPRAHVHGVATFYTQYYKEKMGKYVLDVCGSFSCQVCGAQEIIRHLEEKLGIKEGETTEDGMFSIREVECLGACGYAPMLQVTNDQYVNHLTKEKIDKLIEDLKAGKEPEFESMPVVYHQTSDS